VAAETTEWDSYWHPVRLLGSESLNAHLVDLHSAWKGYLNSGFSPEYLKGYCLTYFRLVETVDALSVPSGQEELLRRAMSAVVGFECMGILDSEGFDLPFAAATTTLRNPVYLLARLKWPSVPHSTRFLPLVTLGDGGVASFSHYRRYRLSDDGEFSLLVFPRNDPPGHPRSLAAISRLAGTIGRPSDPFVDDRAARLWENVVRPLVEQASSPDKKSLMAFVDIGAGSGALIAAITHNLAEWATDAKSLRVRVSLVENSTTGVSPRFNEDKVRSFLDKVSRIRMDYRDWLAQPLFREADATVTIAFACKVFDMRSPFDVRAFRTGDLPNPPAEESWFEGPGRSVVTALAGSTDLTESLLVSSQRFQVDDGHVFSQPALSEYFRGVLRVTSGPAVAGAAAASTMGEALHLPVRVFNPTALVTSRGRSVLEGVLARCDYLLIEDADLRPSDLLAHLEAFRLLSQLGVEDLTAKMGLTGNYAYLIWNKGRVQPNLGGERIL